MAEFHEDRVIWFYVDPLWDPTGIHWITILEFVMAHNLDVHEWTTRNVLEVYDLPTLEMLKGLAHHIGVQFLVMEGREDV